MTPSRKPRFQSANDEAEAAERFGIDDAAAQPPAMRADEADVLGEQPRGEAIRGLEVVRPQEHPFVPVDGSRRHGYSACGSVEMGFILQT